MLILYPITFNTGRKYLVLFLLLFLSLTNSFAQSPKVPKHVEFANQKLELSDGVRIEIQKKVNALLSGGTYFDEKLERIRTYLPLIERHIAEEGLPADFKYISIQESSLIGDAVSSSNAVGYWQFKKPTAQEVGMQVDYQIDERMHIISSTVGACRYFKKNNKYLDNWTNSLLSYYTGLGGVKRYTKSSHRGARKMKITRKTHAYVKKFIAHKIAFEALLSTNHVTKVKLVEFENGHGKSFKAISKETGVPVEIIKQYNRWAKFHRVPKNFKRPVLLAMRQDDNLSTVASRMSSSELLLNQTSDGFPVFTKLKSSVPQILKVNRIKAIVAKKGDDISTLAIKGNVSEINLLRYNEINAHHEVKEGEYFYLKRKKNRAKVEMHVLQAGETLWSVAQKYGVKQKSLKRKNRMKSFTDGVEAGRVLWLRKRRPKRTPVEYEEVITEIVIEEEETIKLEAVEESLKPEELSKPLRVSSSASEVTSELPSAVAPVVVPVAVAKPQAKAIYPSVSSSAEVIGLENSDSTHTTSYEKLFEKEEKTSEKINDVVVSEESSTGSLEEIKPEVVLTPDAALETKEAEELYHTVIQGQSLYAISRIYDVNVKELLVWNGLNLNDGIKIGQVLLIKPSSEVKIDTEVELKPDEVLGEGHIVEPKETMYGIARKYGLTIEQLMKWNDKTDYSLVIGESLKVKNK